MTIANPERRRARIRQEQASAWDVAALQQQFETNDEPPAVDDEPPAPQAPAPRKKAVTPPPAPTEQNNQELADAARARDEAIAQAEALRAQLEEYRDIDPKKFRETQRALREKERQEAEAKGDFDRLKAMMVEQHEQEVAALNERVTAAEARAAELQATLDNSRFNAAFDGSSYIREKLVLSPAKARAIYGSHFAWEDGGIVGYNKPAGAKNRTPLVDGRGEPLSFDAAIEMIVAADPDKDSVIRSTLVAGPGSRTVEVQPRAPEPSTFGVSRLAAALAARQKK